MKQFYTQKTANQRIRGLVAGSWIVQEVYDSPAELKIDLAEILLALDAVNEAKDNAQRKLRQFANTQASLEADIHQAIKKWTALSLTNESI